MKLLRSCFIVLVVASAASAQFNPLKDMFGKVTNLTNPVKDAVGQLTKPVKEAVGQLTNVTSLQDLFGNMVGIGAEVVGGFGDVLKRMGTTVGNLTNEMKAHIKNVTDELIEIAKNPMNTFQVKLNENVLQPFNRGLELAFNKNARNFSDKKYAYCYVNYVDLGQVSPIKDQGQCGSCYAFAATASVESFVRKSNISSAIYSEQQIIDCSTGKYNIGSIVLNNGCTGGTPYSVMHYFNDVDVDLIKDYPYKAEAATCAISVKPSKLKFNYKDVLVDNEDHLAYLLCEYGPIVILIYAGTTFNYYSIGIYNDFVTSKQPVDHAVLLVGIEKDWLGTEYWIIKNSWGNQWGEQGYMRVLKGFNIMNMITNNVTVVSTKEIVV